MGEHESEARTGEEEIDEQGRNVTQQRMDDEGTSDSSAPVAFSANEPTPHEGEEGQEPA